MFTPLPPPPAGVYDQSLKEENDSLRWQLDAYRNEVDLLRKEQNKCSRADDENAQTLARTHSPEAQIQLLQQSLHSMQQVGLLLLLLLLFSLVFVLSNH